jgi:hypothetical protein
LERAAKRAEVERRAHANELAPLLAVEETDREAALGSDGVEKERVAGVHPALLTIVKRRR